MIMKIKFQHVISITTSLGKPQLKMFPKNLNLCMSPPDANKLIQVSSNEPNLNFAFHKLYDEKNKDDELFFFYIHRSLWATYIQCIDHVSTEKNCVVRILKRSFMSCINCFKSLHIQFSRKLTIKV